MPEIHDPLPTTTESAIRAIIEQVIADGDAFLVNLSMRGRSGSRVVEVYLDSDDGLGVGQLAKINREIGFLLEAEEIIRGRYTLNVSSPGADRPLVLPRQYRKHLGRELQVRLSGSDEPRIVTGTLKSADEEMITLLGPSGEAETISFEGIEEAIVQLPW